MPPSMFVLAVLRRREILQHLNVIFLVPVHVSGPKIKGFFIQAIDDDYKPIGSFIKNDYSKLHDECSAITHSHPGPKKDVSFIWKAPQHGHGGNVYFRATILEEYDKYWSKVFAKVLRPPHF
ncbi:ferric-chelate reductase 1 [Hyalella azteca]|uniref:Ferric-chelate reductase 1 n=1 Tax=Hyalella azteca TaxID=294128 RepID=A0A979FM41_HYAAZ|nr:ferric-chelate reductase 1 [Hyalella azteca]